MKFGKVAALLFGAYIIYSFIVDGFDLSTDLLTLLVGGACIWYAIKDFFEDNDGGRGRKRTSGGNGTKESPVTDKTRGSIIKYPSYDEVIVQYGDGKVYWRQTDSVIGSYDSTGNVYRADGTRIGKVDRMTDDPSLILDRTYEWEWLLSKGYVDSQYKPAMGLLIGKNYGSYIEPFIDIPGLDFQCLASIDRSSGSKRDDLLGSSAAFIIAVEDGLVDLIGNEFYHTTQKESYYIEKYGYNSYYNQYSKRRDGCLTNSI